MCLSLLLLGVFAKLSPSPRASTLLAWVNPLVLLTMAYRGKGPFKKRLPLRTIAVFPSFDVMGFAVHESTGIMSLAQIKQERKTLRVSTGTLPRNDIEGSATMFTVSAVLRAAGFTLADMRKWGGKIHSVPHPRDPTRRAAIESRSIDAIFDEGIKSWGQTALDNGFRYLPIAGNVLKQMTALGFRRTDMSRCSFHRTKIEVQTLDFSGWPMIVHAGMPNESPTLSAKRSKVAKILFPPTTTNR